MAKGYRHFTQEFKDSAVREVVERSRRVDEVANQVGIYEGTLRRWVKAWRERYGDEPAAAADTGQVGPAAADLAARVAELEKENRRLRERELILKKAAAFFAQDHL